MASALQRALGILELLVNNASGLPLHTVADKLNIPRSAAHRMLTELMTHGYVRQDEERGVYALTTKLVSLGFIYLAETGVVDLAQPILDGLAEKSGELVRLSVVDGERLTWIAKAQGARSGLRYDPDMGANAVLFCTASGHAWLSCLPEREALELVAKDGFGDPADFGPNVPRTVESLLKLLRLARRRGYATVFESSAPGTSAMAAPILHPTKSTVMGVISIAGPHVRLTEKRMSLLAPSLLAATQELSAMGLASPSLGSHPRTRNQQGAALSEI